MPDPEVMAQAGQAVFILVLLGTCGLAVTDTVRALHPTHPSTDLVRAELKRSLPWTAGLAAAQIALILLALQNPDFQPLLPMVILYLVFACFLPFMWAGGKTRAFQCGLPLDDPLRPSPRKWQTLGGVALAGFCLSLGLVVAIDIRPGAAVQQLSDKSISPVAMGVMAIWLMINAPWVEELCFRHYLVPRLGTVIKSRPGQITLWISILIAATLFAIGHAGHMVPAWPKLIQTFIWALALGWARIRFGTFYAIGLHLVWNITSPLIAPFINV
jgi:membrane protease YdiL (CAAX protease family)